MNKPLHIVADEKIPWLEDFFGELGSLTKLPGTQISSTHLSNADILLVRSVTRVNQDLLQNTPVQFVGTATIGFDHLDTAFLQQNNIQWASAPGCNAKAVAQYVLSAACTIGLPHKPRLGIIGAGNVGSRLNEYARSLGWQTMLCDPPLFKQTGDKQYRTLGEVLSWANIISLHTPLTKTGDFPSFQMADDVFFKKMQRDTLLLNTSRGDVIKASSLKQYRDKLSGLVLDVWPSEPNLDLGLLEITSLGTPHIAGYSEFGKLNATSMMYHAVIQQFQIQPRNIYQNIANQLPKGSISQSKTTLGGIISEAVNLTETDRAMRKTLTSAENSAASFEELRRSYTFRKEFSQFFFFPEFRPEKSEKSKLEKLDFNFP